MAEKPQLRIADQDHVPDEDPFAELTRIMGFDPRVPIRREPELDAPESAAAHDIGDDFGIDLEKELMGEFAAGQDGDDASPGSAGADDQPSVAYQPEPQAYGSENAEYEAAAEPSRDFASAPQFEAGVPEAPAIEADAFDAAFASSMEHELSLDGDWVAAEHASADAESVDVGAEEGQSADQSYAADDYDRVSEFDAGPQAGSYQEPVASHGAAHEDLSGHGDWVAAEEDHSPEAHASERADDFAEDFDAALAEVDMDFTAVPLGSAGRAEVELDRELQRQLEQEPVDQVAPVAASSASLEDELNALLGNMAPRTDYAAVPAEMERATPSLVQEAEAHDGQGSYEAAPAAEDFMPEVEPAEAPVAEDLVSAVEAVAEEPFVDNFESEVEAVAEAPPATHSYAYARSNYRAEDLAYTTPVSDVAHVSEAAHVEAHTEPEAEVAEEDDFGFDDAAFDAAFANSIEGRQPEYEGEAVAEDAVEPVRDAADPYADLASLTARFVPTGPVSSWREEARQPDQYAVQYEQEDYPAADEGPAEGFDDIPDIETVEVPEQAVALSDDLDIPEVVYEEEPAPAPSYDDIDAEFASLLNDMNSPEPSPAASASDADGGAVVADGHAEEREDYAADFAHPAAFAAGAAAAAGALGGAYGQHQAPMMSRQEDFAGQDFPAQANHAGYQQPLPDELDYDPDFDEEMALPAFEEQRRQPQRRGMLIAAIVGGVALIGGIGAFALTGGGSDSQTPALVKADDSPIKVRPENPGGANVPNQDNQVYDAVSRTAGAAAPQPQQEKLVTSAEEPVDMATQEEAEPNEPALAQDTEADAPVPMAKSEDRIEQILDEDTGSAADMPVVAPRKVRTMVVKADGTLVPREEPAPEVAAAPEVNPTASESMVEPNTTGLSTESTAAVPPAPAASEAQANAEPVPAEAGAAPTAAAAPQSSTTPDSVAVAPTRPSDQPVDVVGEVKADKVAALAPAAAGGGWSMQIASQPSEAAAQSSYQDLLRRYGSVLNGHQANIVKAEIAGKGTFWRVRVPADTRDAAIKLCESYKAAGGNCFVSR